MTWQVFSRPNKALLWSLIVSISTVFFVSAVSVSAGTGENARGWLWGGSEEADTNGATIPNNGVIDGNETGLGWLSVNSLTGGGTASYGVNIPLSGGLVMGYGWSENVGWIQFDPANDGSMPPGCTTGVTLSGNSFSGCARVVGIAQEKLLGNSGGWDGWIKMNGSNYGVTLTGSTLNGFAWSSEFGWIDFSRVTVVTTPFVRICPDADAVMIVGQVRDVRAYHFPSGTGSCGDLSSAVDVTADPQTIWSAAPLGPVSLSYNAGSGYEVITANSVGISTVTATYAAIPPDSIQVTVQNIPCACSCDPAEDAQQPLGKTYTKTCSPGCSTSCVGTKKNYWKEIAP